MPWISRTPRKKLPFSVSRSAWQDPTEREDGSPILALASMQRKRRAHSCLRLRSPSSVPSRTQKYSLSAGGA
eukprot:10774126-Heterocapsa_arctica.AAC.1